MVKLSRHPENYSGVLKRLNMKITKQNANKAVASLR